MKRTAGRGRIVETKALVLRRFDYGDTSQVAHVFGVEEGRVSVLAKGIKKPNPRLKGPFDLFHWGELGYRRGAEEGLGLATRWTPEEDFRGLRTSLPRFYSACYLLELLYEITREGDAQPELLREALRGLRELATVEPKRLPTTLVAVELVLFERGGFGLRFAECAACGRALAPGASRFEPRQAGFLCGDCRPSGGIAVPCRAGTRAALEALRREPRDAAARVRLSPDQYREIRGVLREFGREVFEKNLRSEAFAADPRRGFPRAPRRPGSIARR